MKKSVIIVLSLIICLVFCSCSAGVEQEPEQTTDPVLTSVQQEQYEFEPFNLSETDFDSIFPNDSDKIEYNGYLISIEYNGVYAFNTSTNEKTLIFKTGYNGTLIALHAGRLFFCNDKNNLFYIEYYADNEVEKSRFVCDDFKSLLRFEENKILFYNNDDLLFSLDTSTGDKTEIKLKYRAEFEPFKTNGDYYSFSSMDSQYPRSKDKISFYFRNADDDFNKGDIVAEYNANQNPFKLNLSNDTIVIGVIDNALYFIADSNSDNAGLYRLEFESSIGVIKESKLTLVIKGYYFPVKAYNDKLIISKGEAARDGEYYEFDTQTGETGKIKFNYSAFFNDYRDEIKISEDDAEKIAKKELKNSKYFDMGNNDGSFNLQGHPQFCVEPHYTFGYGAGYVYEEYPQYVYSVILSSYRYYAQVDVNAKTGKVVYVYTSLND